MVAESTKYLNEFAKKHGYTGISDYVNERNWNSGKFSPLGEDEDSNQWLGIYIGEKIAIPILEEIFGGIKQIMPYGNPKYEYIVKGGFKVDVKTTTISDIKNAWKYHIGYNNVTDYFLLLAFDNRENLILLHIWLIGKNERILYGKNKSNKRRIFYDRIKFSIPNNEDSMIEYKKYDHIDKLEKYKELLDYLRKERL